MNYWTNRAKVKSMRLYNEKKQSFYPRINHGKIPASFITHRYMVPFVLPAGFSFWRGQGHAPSSSSGKTSSNLRVTMSPGNWDSTMMRLEHYVFIK